MRRFAALGVLVGLAALAVPSCGWAADHTARASSDGLSPQAVDALRLVESKDPYQQQLGFLRLEALREPATVEVIRPYLKHRNENLRAWSARALAAIQGVQAIPTLLDLLAHDRQPVVRRSALLGLEPLRDLDPTMVSAFFAALRDPNPEVRMAAVDVVSRLDSGRAKEAILLRRKRESNRDVRRVITLAMQRMGLS